MPWCRDLELNECAGVGTWSPLNALCEGIECPVRRDWIPCVKGLDALCEGT